MTPAERAATAVLELFETGDHERIRDLVTADFVDHGAPPGLPPGPKGYIGVLRFLTEVLQIRYEVHDIEHSVLVQVGALPAPTLPPALVVPR